jgi:hypothetical protein
MNRRNFIPYRHINGGSLVLPDFLLLLANKKNLIIGEQCIFVHLMEEMMV